MNTKQININIIIIIYIVTLSNKPQIHEMADDISYIYNYQNPAYRLYDAFKNGSCDNLHKRLARYTTPLVERGGFIDAYEFRGKIDGHSTAEHVENRLQHYLVSQKKHVYKGGGTEFFLNESAILIEPFIHSLKIPYKKLSPEDIELLSRPSTTQSLSESQILTPLTRPTLSENTRYKPHEPVVAVTETESNISSSIEQFPYVDEPVIHEHQSSALVKIDQLLEVYPIVKIIWACGLGKALLGVFAVKRRNFQTVAIGVPSNYLQTQMRFEIMKLFPSAQNILFVGGDSIIDNYGTTHTTNAKEMIREFLENPHITGTKFVITTYHSCHLLAADGFEFDFKIGDEAHHLACIATTDPTRRTFQRFHDIQSKYTLFMTATEKIVDNVSGKEVYSMDDERVFGKLVESKSVKWAIDNRKITDYMVVLLKNREDDIDALIRNLQIEHANKDLFLSAYMSLKSIEKYSSGRSGGLTHMLLYTNTTEDADLVNQYIHQIMEYGRIAEDTNNPNTKTPLVSFESTDLYAKSLHSNLDHKISVDTELTDFKRSRFGIISCVYMFGEGVNIPELNGVCLASNMKSEIRIVQYVLRPNRLNAQQPDKIAYIVVPILDSDEFAKASSVRFGRVKETVSQLRNIDEHVSSKMRLVEVKPHKPSSVDDDDDDTDDEDNSVKSNKSTLNLEMFESEEELAKIKLRLRYSKALGSTHTQEHDEYEYVRGLNREFGITCTQKYAEVKETHPHYIDNPDIYFPEMWINWYHFWGVDTSDFIDTKEEWIRFCREKKVVTVSDYLVLCAKYDCLPLNPELLYKGFTNICHALRVESRRR